MGPLQSHLFGKGGKEQSASVDHSPPAEEDKGKKAENNHPAVEYSAVAAAVTENSLASNSRRVKALEGRGNEEIQEEITVRQTPSVEEVAATSPDTPANNNKKRSKNKKNKANLLQAEADAKGATSSESSSPAPAPTPISAQTSSMTYSAVLSSGLPSIAKRGGKKQYSPPTPKFIQSPDPEKLSSSSENPTLSTSTAPKRMSGITPPGTSTSWTSPQAEKKAKLARLQNNALHLGLLDSPVFPKTVAEKKKKKLTQAIDMNNANEKLEKAGLTSEINITHSKKPEELFRIGKKSKAEKAVDSQMGAARMMTVLGEETTIWKQGYEDLPERRYDDINIETRAPWPEASELKAEGEHRQQIFGERRLPLPRKDYYSPAAVMNKVAQGATYEELAQHMSDEIPWNQKDVVAFKGLDKLESTERERLSPYKAWDENGVVIPPKTSMKNRNKNAGLLSGPSSSSNTASSSLGPSPVQLPGMAAGGDPGINAAFANLWGQYSTQYQNEMGHMGGASGSQMWGGGQAFGGSLGQMTTPTPPRVGNTTTQGFAVTASRAVSGNNNGAGLSTPTKIPPFASRLTGTRPPKSTTPTPPLKGKSTIRATAQPFVPGALPTPPPPAGIFASNGIFIPASFLAPTPTNAPATYHGKGKEKATAEEEEDINDPKNPYSKYKNDDGSQYMRDKGFGELLDMIDEVQKPKEVEKKPEETKKSKKGKKGKK
ncbi:hypothetical protein G7Y89_g582 [Cudoniella acicularis]|uniref:Uncharacterized protein n=1 Tax=Cudoniella acicularis TaxID=354080 RepID=A0A8H4RWW4_9HELO|nr:hypothetical protein G7Y89_g582 [Cudoniella acicularis]